MRRIERTGELRAQEPSARSASREPRSVEDPYRHALWTPALPSELAAVVSAQIDDGVAWIPRVHPGCYEFEQLDLGEPEASTTAVLSAPVLDDLRHAAAAGLGTRVGEVTHVEAHLMRPGHYFDWHTDSPMGARGPNEFRVVIVLSGRPDVSGGALGLRPFVPCDQQVWYPPEYNTAIAFQLSPYHEHGVSQVTSGWRRSVVVSCAQS